MGVDALLIIETSPEVEVLRLSNLAARVLDAENLWGHDKLEFPLDRVEHHAADDAVVQARRLITALRTLPVARFEEAPRVHLAPLVDGDAS